MQAGRDLKFISMSMTGIFALGSVLLLVSISISRSQVMISYFNSLTNKRNIFICVVVEQQRLWFSWMLVYTRRIPMGMSMIPTIALY